MEARKPDLAEGWTGVSDDPPSCADCGRRVRTLDRLRDGRGSKCWRQYAQDHGLLPAHRVRLPLPRRRAPVRQPALFDLTEESEMLAVTDRPADLDDTVEALAQMAKRLRNNDNPELQGIAQELGDILYALSVAGPAPEEPPPNLIAAIYALRGRRIIFVEHAEQPCYTKIEWDGRGRRVETIAGPLPQEAVVLYG